MDGHWPLVNVYASEMLNCLSYLLQWKILTAMLCEYCNQNQNPAGIVRT